MITNLRAWLHGERDHVRSVREPSIQDDSFAPSDADSCTKKYCNTASACGAAHHPELIRPSRPTFVRHATRSWPVNLSRRHASARLVEQWRAPRLPNRSLPRKSARSGSVCPSRCAGGSLASGRPCPHGLQDRAGTRRLERDEPLLKRKLVVRNQFFPCRLPCIDPTVDTVDRRLLARDIAIKQRSHDGYLAANSRVLSENPCVAECSMALADLTLPFFCAGTAGSGRGCCSGACQRSLGFSLLPRVASPSSDFCLSAYS